MYEQSNIREFPSEAAFENFSLDFYSPSYDTVIAETLYNFGGIELLPAMKEIFINGENGKKAYAAKYFSYVPKEYLNELLPAIRKTAESEFEPLSANSIDILSNMKDDEFKNNALKLLNSDDEFCFVQSS